MDPINKDMRWSELMQLAQRGDDIAYKKLLTELRRVIAQSLRYRFGAFSFVDDCVQESLIAIHQARHTYQPNRPFTPWMNAIVRYKTIDLMRKHYRYQEMQGDDPEVVSLESCLMQSNVSIDDKLSGAQLLALIDQPHRDALIYTKFIGLSVEDAAIKLDVSADTVKQRVKRAIAKTTWLLEESLK